MIPFRIKWEPLVELRGEAEKARLALNAHRPLAQRRKHEYPVAVVGGGPSLVGRLDELRSWPGDVWAINKTADWLIDQGIDCAFYTVDAAGPDVIPISKAKRAILASWCHPARFVDGAEMFHLSEHAPEGVPGGTTTATRAPCLALRLGYPGVHFFGCDSSFAGQDHVDRHDPIDAAVIVRASGRDFMTYPELLMQAECLTTILGMAPEVFINKSDGLLKAMQQDDQWSIVAVSAALKEHLNELNGDTGLYDSPYTPEASR